MSTLRFLRTMIGKTACSEKHIWAKRRRVLGGDRRGRGESQQQQQQQQRTTVGTRKTEQRNKSATRVLGPVGKRQLPGSSGYFSFIFITSGYLFRASSHFRPATPVIKTPVFSVSGYVIKKWGHNRWRCMRVGYPKTWGVNRWLCIRVGDEVNQFITAWYSVGFWLVIRNNNNNNNNNSNQFLTLNKHAHHQTQA